MSRQPSADCAGRGGKSEVMEVLLKPMNYEKVFSAENEASEQALFCDSDKL